MEGGDPALDAKKFWANIRRGLLRASVDRIGLGGYLHLVQDFPDFVEAIEHITEEFRTIKQLHVAGEPYTAPVKVAILTAWGKWRSWDYVGHFIPGIEIYEITESLAGLPVDVSYISFNDLLENGIPKEVDVIINAGKIGTAWSGGEHWKNEKVIEAVNEWVSNGGGFIGIGEPSATEYTGQYFQLSQLLGVDKEIGLTTNNTKIAFEESEKNHFILEDLNDTIDFGKDIDNVFVLNKSTKVLKEKNGSVQISVNSFGKGTSVYFSGFKFSAINTRLLFRSLFFSAGKQNEYGPWTSSNVNTDCSYYPNMKKLVVINSSDNAEETTVYGADKQTYSVKLDAHGIQVIDV
jgi:beta-D-galactosyl-(1->4)-L-rhamnose phosphorylase